MQEEVILESGPCLETNPLEYAAQQAAHYSMRHIARVYGREQASRARVTGESMEEDDMVKSIGIAYRDERIKKRRQARGA